jgi:hypothetical protein
MKPDVNSVEVHLQPSHNGHPVDGVLVGAGSLWPNCVVPSGDQLGVPVQNAVHNGDSYHFPKNRVDMPTTGH